MDFGILWCDYKWSGICHREPEEEGCGQHVYSISKISEPALEELSKSLWRSGIVILTTVLNNFGPVDIRINDAIRSGAIKACIWAQQVPFLNSQNVIPTSS